MLKVFFNGGWTSLYIKVQKYECFSLISSYHSNSQSTVYIP